MTIPEDSLFGCVTSCNCFTLSEPQVSLESSREHGDLSSNNHTPALLCGPRQVSLPWASSVYWKIKELLTF